MRPIPKFVHPSFEPTSQDQHQNEGSADAAVTLLRQAFHTGSPALIEKRFQACENLNGQHIPLSFLALAHKAAGKCTTTFESELRGWICSKLLEKDKMALEAEFKAAIANQDVWPLATSDPKIVYKLGPWVFDRLSSDVLGHSVEQSDLFKKAKHDAISMGGLYEQLKRRLPDEDDWNYLVEHFAALPDDAAKLLAAQVMLKANVLNAHTALSIKSHLEKFGQLLPADTVRELEEKLFALLKKEVIQPQAADTCRAIRNAIAKYQTVLAQKHVEELETLYRNALPEVLSLLKSSLESMDFNRVHSLCNGSDVMEGHLRKAIRELLPEQRDAFMQRVQQVELRRIARPGKMARGERTVLTTVTGMGILAPIPPEMLAASLKANLSMDREATLGLLTDNSLRPVFLELGEQRVKEILGPLHGDHNRTIRLALDAIFPKGFALPDDAAHHTAQTVVGPAREAAEELTKAIGRQEGAHTVAVILHKWDGGDADKSLLLQVREYRDSVRSNVRKGDQDAKALLVIDRWLESQKKEVPKALAITGKTMYDIAQLMSGALTGKLYAEVVLTFQANMALAPALKKFADFDEGKQFLQQLDTSLPELETAGQILFADQPGDSPVLSIRHALKPSPSEVPGMPVSDSGPAEELPQAWKEVDKVITADKGRMQAWHVSNALKAVTDEPIPARMREALVSYLHALSEIPKGFSQQIAYNDIDQFLKGRAQPARSSTYMSIGEQNALLKNKLEAGDFQGIYELFKDNHSLQFSANPDVLQKIKDKAQAIARERTQHPAKQSCIDLCDLMHLPVRN